MTSTWSFCLLLFLVVAVLFVDCSISKVRLNNEKLLIKTLTENYGQKLGLPTMKDRSEPLLIKLRIQLIQIVELDAIKQVLSTNIWSSYTWQDPFLTWDPAKYNGLETIRIPASFAFEHDITLLNSADERLEFKREALLVIYHTGDLLWIPRSLFVSTCYIDLKVFPFDKQNCSLSFGSWAYDSNQIDLGFQDDIDNIDLNDYEKSKEWNLDPDESMALKHFREFEGKNYTVLTYRLIMRRNPRFYTYLLLYPCIMLAFLTMTVFWLPPENPSKIILGMSIFSGFFLLLLLLADLVPTSTNEVPYIGLYFCLNMVMIALSSFLCTIVVHMYFRADTFCRVPKIIKKIFLEWLAYIYLMKPAKSAHTVTQRTLLNSGLLLGGKNVPNADKFEKFELLKERFKSYRENVLKIGFENLLKTHPSTLTASSCMNLNHHHNMSMSNFNLNHASSTAASSPTSTLNLNTVGMGGRQPASNNCQCAFCSYCAQQQTVLAEIAYLNNLEHDVKEIRDYLRDTRKKLETKELKIKLASDWKQIALVLDRTFFFIYLFITATTLILYYREIYLSQKQVNTTKKVPTPTETTAAAAAAAGSADDGSLMATTTEAMVANLAQPAARMLRAIGSVTAQTFSFASRRQDEPTDDNRFLFF